MAVEITIRFENDDEADVFQRHLEHGYIDGHRLRQLKGEITVVGERQDLREGKN